MHFSQQMIGGLTVQYITYPQHFTAFAGGAVRMENPPAKTATSAKSRISALNFLRANIN
jgi:hypothetical protein